MALKSQVARSEAALQILQSRDGLRTNVALASGRSIEVWNVAWGRDMGDEFDHVTTNMSPAPSAAHEIDVFFTNEIAAISDSNSGKVLFRRNSLDDLSEQEQVIIKRCLEYVLEGGDLSEEFDTRMGVSERAVKELLARWPQVGHVGDGSDDIAINNAMNEVVNGISISDAG